MYGEHQPPLLSGTATDINPGRPRSTSSEGRQAPLHRKAHGPDPAGGGRNRGRARRCRKACLCRVYETVCDRVLEVQGEREEVGSS